MSWTDERVETLRKLWLRGLSATQIAEELSNGVTRNAVVGKLHRLGLNVGARPGSAKGAAPTPASQNVTIMELRESMCRWPLGDPASPGFRYCGADAPIGEGPYCKFHMRVAYQPAQDRRRAKVR